MPLGCNSLLCMSSSIPSWEQIEAAYRTEVWIRPRRAPSASSPPRTETLCRRNTFLVSPAQDVTADGLSRRPKRHYLWNYFTIKRKKSKTTFGFRLSVLFHYISFFTVVVSGNIRPVNSVCYIIYQNKKLQTIN